MTTQSERQIRERITSTGACDVEMIRGGPALVRGASTVADREGRDHPATRPVVAVCTCDLSQRAPWCDDTHRVIPGTDNTFRSGGEFTVGAEEELILVDENHRLRTDGTPDLVERLRGRTRPGETVSTELFAAEIEFATAVCRTAEEVRDVLAGHRSALRRAGARAMAVGVHPAAPFGDAVLTRSARYDPIGESLAGLLRTPTAALQVHVGMPDGDTAMTALRGLRPQLALFRALAAGSPYWHGLDSGLASSRWAVLRSYPRGGVPPAVVSWEEYVSRTDALAFAAEVPDYTRVWWDLRAQPRLGTLEVRVMDAVPTLDAVAGLVALVQGLARHAVEQPATIDLPGEVLDENDFRVARHGLDARIVAVDGTMHPVRELVRDALAAARDVLSADGLDAPLTGIDKLLTDVPEYERQRRLHRDHGMTALLADLTARTEAGR